MRYLIATARFIVAGILAVLFELLLLVTSYALTGNANEPKPYLIAIWFLVFHWVLGYPLRRLGWLPPRPTTA